MTKIDNSLTRKLQSLHIVPSNRYWDAIRSLELKVVVSNASKKDCMEIALDQNALYNISFSIANQIATDYQVQWATRSISDEICEGLVLALVGSADKLLKNSKNSLVKNYIFNNGLYSDVKLINNLALNSNGELQALAAGVCSISTLRKLNKRNNLSKQVRSTIYQRLGPVECLDQMIDDKYANNRTEGYRWAPYGYAKLEEKAITEIARGPTTMLIKKLKQEVLPLLLANRNVLKNQWVAKQIQQRMDAGE